MKTKTLKHIGLAIAVMVGMSACTGLKKMAKKANTVTYTVTPNPMEMHGDSIAVTVTGKYPEKYFGKKVVLTFTPVVKWQGGQKEMKPITIIGEKVTTATGQKITYKTGGSFTYTDKIAYQPEMKNCELVVKAQGAVKKKTKDMPEMKMADGTIITPLLVKSDDMPIIGKDQFVRNIPMSQPIEIFFLINQSNVRPTETSKKEMKDFKKWVENTLKDPARYGYKNITISAYASPDGEMLLNQNLANERAESSKKYFQGMFKEKNTKYENGTGEGFYQIQTTAEDWAGFEKLVKESTDKKVMENRDVILGVLKMYPDLETREKEIKNLAATYTELADKILPKLRRSVDNLNYDKIGRSDEQLLKFATTTPDSLNVEEILYAATLTNDVNTKLTIYKNAEKMYANDWRVVNNVGVAYLMLNKLSEAQTQFDKADKLSPNNPIIKNNLGICSRWKGDRKMAMDLYKQANGAGPEVAYNMGIIDIQNGNYASASSNFGNYKTFNAALALVLQGNLDGASSTLDQSKEKEDALSYYLKAIIGARKGDTNMMINNLKTAIQKDASLKEKAKTDMEFFKYWENADFKSVVG
ncbi:MAG: hypothetical protein AB1458_02180 [Bacteroidota bacterium]